MISRIIGITGSRDYRPRMKESLWKFIHSLPRDHTCMVVTGDARGIDKITLTFARNLKIPSASIPYISSLGLKGGFARNRILVDFCTEIWGFWNLISLGTRDCIEYAKEQGKLKSVIGPNGEELDLNGIGDFRNVCYSQETLKRKPAAS